MIGLSSLFGPISLQGRKLKIQVTGDYPQWVYDRRNAVKTRNGLDRFDIFFRIFNKTRIYENCLKSTPRFVATMGVGSILAGYGWSCMWDAIWYSINKEKMYRNLPYVYPLDEDDD